MGEECVRNKSRRWNWERTWNKREDSPL